MHILPESLAVSPIPGPRCRLGALHGPSRMESVGRDTADSWRAGDSALDPLPLSVILGLSAAGSTAEYRQRPVPWCAAPLDWPIACRTAALHVPDTPRQTCLGVNGDPGKTPLGVLTVPRHPAGARLGRLDSPSWGSETGTVFRHSAVFSLVHARGAAAESAFLSDAADALGGIPGVREFAVSRQIGSGSDLDWEFSLLFDDEAAYTAYRDHPSHVAFTTMRWKPEVARFQAFDFIEVSSRLEEAREQ